MADEHAIARYRHWYRKLLRFYSRPYRERFGESMEQTFNDLCRERAEAGEGLFGFVLWMFVETSAGIIRENGRFIVMGPSGDLEPVSSGMPEPLEVGEQWLAWQARAVAWLGARGVARSGRAGTEWGVTVRQRKGRAGVREFGELHRR